jgi:hypothetical protein
VLLRVRSRGDLTPADLMMSVSLGDPNPNPHPDPHPHPNQSRGDFILVGDLMKSVSLLQCTAASGELKELSRDFNATWMTAVSFLADDTFLGAENWCAPPSALAPHPGPRLGPGPDPYP